MERSCPVCGEPTTTAARFCSACGVDLQAQVILDPVAPPEAPESVGERRSLSMLLVPLGVVVAIGLAVLFLVSGGDEDPEPAAVDGVVQAPTATPLPTPTATPIRVILPERTPIQPTPTRTPSLPQALEIDTVDLSPLPATDATHLAVAHDRDLAYLDLTTGEWIIHERVNLSSVPGINSLVPFGRGVVTSSGEAVFYIPVDERPQVLGEGEVLGVVDGLFYARDWSTPGGPTILAFDERGEQVGTLELPGETWVVDVLTSGVFLIDGGGHVFIATQDRSDLIATGNISGVAGDRVLVFSCVDGLDSCRHILVDVAADTQVDVQIPVRENQSMRLAPDGRVLVWELLGGGATAFTLDDNGVPVAEEELLQQQATLVEVGITGPAVATDTTGLYARVEGDRLLFHGPTGDAITEVALDFLPGFGDSYALAFVNSDG